MRNAIVCLIVSVALLCCATRVRADIVPVYSFESIIAPNGPDGFFGLGATVTQDTIGTTAGSFSMKYAAAAGGFVGVRTESVPASLNNPPGVLSVMFDINIPEIPVGLTFADIGVTVFGHDIDNGVFGIQNQFTDTVSITTLGVGQHLDRIIDLDSEFNSGESFNQIFGDDVSDLDVASAFQFYLSKNAGVPVTVYIDNVRLVTVPEPTTIGLCAGAAMLGALRRRR